MLCVELSCYWLSLFCHGIDLSPVFSFNLIVLFKNGKWLCRMSHSPVFFFFMMSWYHNLFLTLFELEVKSMTRVNALWPRAKSYPQPVFVNKVLLKHNYTQLFRYRLWLPLPYDGIGGFVAESIWSQKTKIFVFSPFTENSASPWSRWKLNIEGKNLSEVVLGTSCYTISSARLSLH